MWCIITENLKCLATMQSTAVPPIITEQKLCTVRKAPIWSQRERLHCSASLHLSSRTPSSCCAGLAARRGFLLWFLCWRSKFPGMWNQRRHCHVSPCSFFNLPSSSSGIESNTCHLPWETAAACADEAALICVITQCAKVCKSAQSDV